MQLAAFELAEQQRRERPPLLVGDAVAADDELLVAEAFDLQPARRPARHVRLVGLLGDDAFEAEAAGLRENLVAMSDDVFAVADGVGRALQQLAQDLFAVRQRLIAQVAPVELQDVEHVVGERGAPFLERVLQPLEARAPVIVKRDDLAVE